MLAVELLQITFGLNGFNFSWSGPEGGNFFPLDTSGTLTRAITAGNSYTVNIRNQANIFGGFSSLIFNSLV